MTVGQRIKIVIEKNNLTQKEFAASIGIRQNQMSLIINNKGELQHKSLACIVSKFGININWLITGDGPIYVTPPDSNLVGEPKSEYKVSKEPVLSAKYTQAIERLTEAKDKEIHYLKRIMELERQLNDCLKKSAKK